MLTSDEILVLEKLEHENIVKYKGNEIIHNALYIYMEYIAGGSLSEIISKYGKIDESLIRIFLRQILKGLIYLHSNSIIHMDLKCSNIL